MIPLAYMRGRTLNEAFIILDEAQNTTVAQMKMFLTRMGNGSKIVVSGDITQIDLPPHTRSGLIDGLTRLRGIPGVRRGGADRRPTSSATRWCRRSSRRTTSGPAGGTRTTSPAMATGGQRTDAIGAGGRAGAAAGPVGAGLGRARRRDVLLRIGLCLLAAVRSASVIRGWDPPFIYRTGQVLAARRGGPGAV